MREKTFGLMIWLTFIALLLSECRAQTNDVPGYLNKCYSFKDDKIQNDTTCEVIQYLKKLSIILHKHYIHNIIVQICDKWPGGPTLGAEVYPGSCKGNCLAAYMALANIDELIGVTTIGNQVSGCYCGDKYGIDCSSKTPISGDQCVNGIHDPANTVTGCKCTDVAGNPTSFHGWYCDVPNYKQCVPELDQFYVHANTDKVGGKCQKCGYLIDNCSKCEQINDTGKTPIRYNFQLVFLKRSSV